MAGGRSTCQLPHCPRRGVGNSCEPIQRRSGRRLGRVPRVGGQRNRQQQCTALQRALSGPRRPRHLCAPPSPSPPHPRTACARKTAASPAVCARCIAACTTRSSAAASHHGIRRGTASTSSRGGHRAGSSSAGPAIAAARSTRITAAHRGCAARGHAHGARTAHVTARRTHVAAWSGPAWGPHRPAHAHWTHMAPSSAGCH